MRILLVNFARSWRGGERQTLFIATTLQQRGFKVEVLVYKGGDLAQRLKALGVPVVEKKSPVDAIMYLLLHAKRYQIFHSQTASSLTWLALLKWRFKKHTKVIFTRRTAFPLGFDPADKNNKRLRRLVWKWQQVDAFAAVSRAAAEGPEALGFSPVIVPSAVTYVPADTAFLDNYKKQHAITAPYVLGTAAALSKEKDPITTIRAVNALWQQRQDFIFLHFGADDVLKDEAVALVKELGLEQVYRFMGFSSRMEEMYRLLDVFVLTSEFEAFSGSLLDAYLYKVPVVATKVGGSEEILSQGRGIACEVADFEAIAEGCNRFLSDEAYKEATTAAAQQWVQDHYGVEQMVESYVQIYKKALA